MITLLPKTRRSTKQRLLGVHALVNNNNNKNIYIKKKKHKKTLQTLPKAWKTIIILNNLRSFGWITGEVIDKKHKNLTILKNYVIGLRYNHAIYTVHLLLIRFRIVLHMLCQRTFYKKRCLINYAHNSELTNKSLKTLGIENFAKRTFMVTWRNWLGGVLTNFKLIAKRIISKTKNKHFRQATGNLFVSYVKNIPRLPSFVISTSNSHWALNETQQLRLNHLQLANTNHLGNLGHMTLSMSTQYYSLRSFTVMLEECVSSVKLKRKLCHKSRILHYINNLVKKRDRDKNKLYLNNLNIKLNQRNKNNI